jgi:glucose/arabinose dehydrogenase
MTKRSVMTRISIGLLAAGVAAVSAITPASAYTMNKQTSLTGYTVSRNRCFSLGNERGNFVVRNTDTKDILWQTRTSGNGNMLKFQPDGNLVVYSGQRDRQGNRRPLWASNTDRGPGMRVTLQDDGNLVMYDRNRGVVWASNVLDTSYVNQRCR